MVSERVIPRPVTALKYLEVLWITPPEIEWLMAFEQKLSLSDLEEQFDGKLLEGLMIDSSVLEYRYSIEFQREEGKWITACWPECDSEVEIGSDWRLMFMILYFGRYRYHALTHLLYTYCLRPNSATSVLKAPNKGRTTVRIEAYSQWKSTRPHHRGDLEDFCKYINNQGPCNCNGSIRHP